LDSKQQNGSLDFSWTPEQELVYEFNVEPRISNNVCRLLDEGNSIPFIARYRKEATGGMEPNTLREFKESFETLKGVQEKATKQMAAVEKVGKLTPSVKRAFLAARSLAQLEVVNAPFKTGSKASLAERARTLGLGDVAKDILEGLSDSVNLHSFINPKTQGLEKLEDVKAGIQHVVADLLVHDNEVSASIRKLQKDARIILETKQSTAKTKDKKPAAARTAADAKKKTTAKKPGKEEDPLKFENYFAFSIPVNFIKSHQVLAINRGESLKILSVKVNLPDDWLLNQLRRQIQYRWLNKGRHSPLRGELVESALKDGYKRLISPLMVRTCRSDLTKSAENAAILSFAENLRKLLLTPPLRGKPILSIDPGFSHGCKLAVISENGDVLDTAVIHPRFKDPGQDGSAIRELTRLVKDNSAETLAIGNGTGCRETQQLVSWAIRSGTFKPNNVRYTIVDERGASIYSCSPVAQKEFPKMDTNLISAVSLGRRVQDPISEYVKIEPHHLGCGMYQHDVSQTKLNATLDDIVVECVSFVGVNLNSCSEHLLKRVAGLTATRAKAIIEYRKKNGNFMSRDELKTVKGIGDKVYEQCAGFLRISNLEASAEKSAKSAKKSKKCAKNLLDATNIHPESYAATTQLLNKAGTDLNDLGTAAFLQKLEKFLASQDQGLLAASLKIGVPTLDLITGCLRQGLEYDYRQEFDAPIFREGMTRMEDVKIGTELTGRVSNVTDFGAFVDIGIGKDGLLHVSKMKGSRVELGNRVEVRVLNIDAGRGKIGLELVKML